MTYKTEETAIKHLNNGQNFKSVKFDGLRDNKNVVMTAVKKDSWALEWASDELKDDREVVMTAIKDCVSAMRFASQRLRDDESFMLEAVKINGSLLYFASENLQNNKEVVLEAVNENAYAAKYASEEIQELCKDKDPVLAIQTEIKRLDAEKLLAELTPKKKEKTSKKLKV